jgi:hypothetical protein
MSKPKIGSKWTGKTAASAIGTVGIVDNSDDTILLTNTKGSYKVKEILSREDFNELVAEETGKKVKGKNPTNRNMARALQNQYNKQNKSQANKKSTPKAPARSPSPNRAAASNSSMTTTRRRRPQVAPVKVNNKTRRQRPKVARETSLERNLRLIAEAEAKETENLASALNAVKLANNNTKMAIKLQEEENEQFARQLENQEKQEKKRKSVRRTK